MNAQGMRKQLVQIVHETVIRYVKDESEATETANTFVHSFADITEPEIDTTIHLLTIDMERRRGRSLKPGNAVFNWKKLLTHASESVLTVAGSVAFPWLIPFAALAVWNRVWSLLTIELGETHAVVIWTMWNNCDSDHQLSADKVLPLVNNELLSYSRQTINKEELEHVLHDLKRMTCIEKTDDNTWWLREWVCVTYN